MKIVITGGAYSGKTSIITELSKQGYKTIPEASMQIISELNNKLGIEKQKEWRLKNFLEFITIIMERQKEFESNLQIKQEEIIFFDRGMHDCVAYAEFMNIDIPQKHFDILNEYKYDLIFVCETLSNFNHRHHTGRISDKERSIKVKNKIHDFYKNYGFKVILINEMSVKERVEFIKKQLNL